MNQYVGGMYKAAQDDAQRLAAIERFARLDPGVNWMPGDSGNPEDAIMAALDREREAHTIASDPFDSTLMEGTLSLVRQVRRDALQAVKDQLTIDGAPLRGVEDWIIEIIDEEAAR